MSETVNQHTEKDNKKLPRKKKRRFYDFFFALLLEGIKRISLKSQIFYSFGRLCEWISSEDDTDSEEDIAEAA